MKIIERTLRGLQIILTVFIITAAIVMSVVPAVLVVDLGYTPWVLLTYVPMMLPVAYALGSMFE